MTTGKRPYSFNVSPDIIFPIPKVKETVNKTNQKKGKTPTLTYSPYQELETTTKEKEEDLAKFIYLYILLTNRRFV